MRTTLDIDDDVAVEVERLRREEGLGLSEAVNRLIRNGMARTGESSPFTARTADIGLTVDVANVADVLDLLDER